MSWWWPFKKESLEDRLNKTRTVKIMGIIFKIKKIDPVHCLNGSKVMLSYYDTYKRQDQSQEMDNGKAIKKLKEHLKDVFLASVVEPKLKRKDDPNQEGIFVENLFTEWDLCMLLYEEINIETYGKKKFWKHRYLKLL